MKDIESPFSKAVYHRNAEIYKILANPKRLEILNTIKFKEATVDQLARMLKANKANVSQHLTLLRHLKIVNVRRVGKNAFYKIADPRIVEPCRILKKIWGK